MSAWFRAGLFAALFVFVTTPSPAAEKTFQDEALDDAAITLESELKDEAGTVEKPLAKLTQEAEALLKRQDLEAAANVYVQIVTLTPDDAKAWRRLADIWLLDARRARPHRRLHRLSARDDAGGGIRLARHACQRFHQARGMAPGVERAEARARTSTDARASDRL